MEVSWLILSLSMSKYSQEYVVHISILLDNLQDMLQHDGANAESSVRAETAQRHNVESPSRSHVTVNRLIDATTNCAHNDIIIVRELAEIARIQHIQIEFVVVCYREHYRVDLLQLLEIVVSTVTQLDYVFPKMQE